MSASIVPVTQYPGDVQPLIDWVYRAGFKPSNNAQSRIDEPPAEFVDWARRMLPADSRLKFWSNHVTPHSEIADGWVRGFPHVHAWDATVWTLLCYLTDCEGGQIEVSDFPDMARAESVQPAPGVCVMCHGDQWHGVRPVTAGERLGVVVTAFPQGYAKH